MKSHIKTFPEILAKENQENHPLIKIGLTSEVTKESTNELTNKLTNRLTKNQQKN